MKPGERFGKLTSLKVVGIKKYSKGEVKLWRCKCDCGNYSTPSEWNLTSGKTKSCGCQKGRFTHRECYTKFYKRFFGIIDRCTNRNARAYKNYGGRGISCKWKRYEDFKKDMYKSFISHCNRYGECNTSIDRIDNNGNYCKENCKWSTKIEQNNNTRKTNL